MSKLTHAHPRSLIGCGIYYSVLMGLLEQPDKKAVENGLAKAKAFYSQEPEFVHYRRLTESGFAALPEQEISSFGYVVATLEAAIWCFLNTESYSPCVLKAVNLGRDTDTVAAVAGAWPAHCTAWITYQLYGIPACSSTKKLKRCAQISAIDTIRHSVNPL